MSLLPWRVIKSSVNIFVWKCHCILQSKYQTSMGQLINAIIHAASRSCAKFNGIYSYIMWLEFYKPRQNFDDSHRTTQRN